MILNIGAGVAPVALRAVRMKVILHNPELVAFLAAAGCRFPDSAGHLPVKHFFYHFSILSRVRGPRVALVKLQKLFVGYLIEIYSPGSNP